MHTEIETKVVGNPSVARTYLCLLIAFLVLLGVISIIARVFHPMSMVEAAQSTQEPLTYEATVASESNPTIVFVRYFGQGDAIDSQQQPTVAQVMSGELVLQQYTGSQSARHLRPLVILAKDGFVVAYEQGSSLYIDQYDALALRQANREYDGSFEKALAFIQTTHHFKDADPGTFYVVTTQIQRPSR